MNRLKRVGFWLMISVAVIALLGFSGLIIDGKREPPTNARYVALGSSFAAGLGLGERAADSPFACQRSVNGYPQQLARLLKISLGDMSCSGATVEHALFGGQFFQGPQIDAIGPNTELVTLTAGGNDVGYVGDLIAMSYRRQGGITGFIADFFWNGSRSVEDRAFAELQSTLVATFQEIARRAPRARIVVATYPVIIPPAGTCAAIAVSESEAALMREVGARLAEVTIAAAQATATTVVDMTGLSLGHDACSPSPWVSGIAPEQGSPFHPTQAGAEATARQIMRVLENEPSGYYGVTDESTELR